MSIFDFNYDELTSSLISWGQPGYRAGQIWDGLYKQLWTNADQFTSLPKILRQKLADEFSLPDPESASQLSFTSLQPVRNQTSSDGETVKTLFSLAQGKTIETVLMRYSRRNTLCISTQSGCAMGCVFCATGQMGFGRHLTSGEIVEQVLYFARQLAASGEKLTNIVVMGMGEPFHNYDSTLAAISRLNHPLGFNFGERRFTVSTVGLIPGIRRFTQEHSQINLAISLHAADNELRSKLLPINNKYPLEDLLPVCLNYVQQTHRRLSFEWALIQDINDTPDQADQLIQLLHPFHLGGSMLCHVNLIPLNPSQKYTGHASTHQRAISFQKILEQAGIPSSIRLRRGIDIQAGCGQLASQLSQ